MYNKEKIIIMSKMAVYDKRDFAKDSQANHYFRHDYIYKRNMQMRFGLGIGCLILILFYVFYLFAVDGADVFALDYQFEALRMLSLVLVIMIGYSFIGTIIYTREFVIAQRRIGKYFALMERLNGEKPPPPVAKKRGFLKAKATPAAEDDDEPLHEPYRPQRPPAADLEYRYRSSDDPEFWDDAPGKK